jgi:MFS family permease
VKLIQHSDERSKQDLDDEPSELQRDILLYESSLQSVKDEKEKLDKIKERIGELEDQIDDMKGKRPSLVNSLRTIFSWRNYSVYLATSWVFTAFSYMSLFFNLYLYTVLEWNIVVIGSVLSIMGVISATSRLIGGYVGDMTNRKHLSVVAMFMMAVYNLIMGIFVGFTWIIIALLFASTMDIFKGGSTAFIMDNIPKKHSGLGISLFTAGRFFGIITLGVFVVLVASLEFQASLQLMFQIGGLFLLGAAILRAILLEGKPPETKRESVSLVKSFVQENKRAAELLFKAVPGMIAIVVLDSLSDALFKFGAYIYIYDQLNMGIPELAVMSIVTILVSVPIMLGTGMLSDRRGEKNIALVIYSIMPFCAILLILAPMFPFWVPLSIVTQANSIFNGLGVIFSTPLLAIVMKSVNDSVWYLMLLTIIQKNLPRRDTAKILSVFWFIVWMLASIGPGIGGFVFENFYQGYLFVIVLLINFIILGWIATKGLVRNSKKVE